MAQMLSVQAVHRGGMRVALQAGTHALESDYPSADHAAAAPTSLELLLAALASCAANGLAFLLRRDGVEPERLEVRATGQRRETHPTVLESIHLEFRLAGAGLEPERVARALELAEQRICPVWAMLSPATPISHSLHLD
jgi:putative redox protein